MNRGTRAGLCQRPARLITGTADGAWPGCWAESGLAAGGGSPARRPHRIHPHRTRRAACSPPEVQQMDGDCLPYWQKKKKRGGCLLFSPLLPHPPYCTSSGTPGLCRAEMPRAHSLLLLMVMPVYGILLSRDE